MKENPNNKDTKLQILVDKKLLRDFKQAIKPLRASQAISSYMRIVVRAQGESLIEVIDQGLEKFIKRVKNE